MIESVRYEPPQLLWIITAETAVAGGTALRSGDIGNGQFSCLSLTLTQPLPAPSRIHFSRRISAEINNDLLRFETDNIADIERFSGTRSELRDWQQGQFLVSATTLSWCYIKNMAVSEGSDSAWIDTLAFVTVDVQPLCDTLDLSQSHCAMIRSVRYEPPQSLWLTTNTAFYLGDSALVSPPLAAGQNACLILDIDSTLPPDSYLAFAWRTTSPSEQDVLTLRAGNQQRQISNMPQWQIATVDFNGAETTLRWCYSKITPANSQTGRGWLDSLLPVTAADRYVVQIAVTEAPTIFAMRPDSIRFQVTITAASPTLPSPLDWVLIASGVENITAADTTYPLVFSSNSAQVDVTVTPDNSLLPSTIHLTLDDRPLLRAVAVTSLTYVLPARELTMLEIMAPAEVTQSTPDAALDIAVTVIARDNFNLLFDPAGLVLTVTDLGNASVPQSTYALSFAAGTARTTITVELTSSDAAAGIELSVSRGDVSDSTAVVLIPHGRMLAQLEIMAPAEVTQTAPDAALDIAVTVISADNYDLPFDPAALELRVSSTDNARVPQSTYALTFTSGTARTTITVELTSSDAAAGIELSVSRGDVSDSAAVVLIPHGRMLAQLEIMAPAEVTQTAPDAALDIAVTVIARDNFNLLFDPAGLVLTVTDLDNASVPQSTYALSFAAGTARTTITAELTVRGIAGSIELSVIGSETRSTARVMLNPTPVRLAVLSIAAPAEVSQSTPNALIEIAVTVIAADNYDLPFDPAALELRISSTDNASVPQSTYALTFTSGTARTTITVELTSSDAAAGIELSVSRGDVSDSAAVVLIPQGRMLAQLEIMAPAEVTQTAPDAALDIAVTVIARDNFNLLFDPAGLVLTGTDLGNARVPQSTYALTFTSGTARTTITAELTVRGIAGSIELSVIDSETRSTASITLNPAPRLLASITLAATNNSLVQTMANSAVAAELILTALDNYGDPIEAGNISLQLFASFDAIVQTTLTVVIEAGGSARQMVDILPQNDLDTVVTVQLLRGTLDESVQLLPDEGIQIAVRARRVLRQLQLGLVNAQSPLRQIDPSLPIRANIRLTGLDQYGQPIAFPEVLLTATAEPTATRVMLNPQRVAATAPEGALTVMEVMFSEILDTTVTIAIADPGTGVTVNELVVRALPDRRPPLRPLYVDDTETSVTELDLIVAMRWLADQQRSTESLVFNLTITSDNITAAAIENLRQLFTNPANLDRIDVNRDGRADQLDLRVLLRHKSGLSDAALAEQELVDGLIKLLLHEP